jgi:hypothetical protein
MDSRGIPPETSNFYCLPGRAGGSPNLLAKPLYESATTLLDFANPLQTVQALNLAGKTQAAWEVLSGGLRSAKRQWPRTLTKP